MSPVQSMEDFMFARLTIAAAAATLASSAALADYYIVQDKTTKECKVVETLPTETTWIQVGPAAFKTRDEASKRLTLVCNEKVK
jgi:hypothetical protein